MIKIVKLITFILLTGGLLSACAPRNSHLPPPAPQEVQIGLASWYGSDFHGRPTANGEIYNMYDITAAHKTLPLGTYVMVTNLGNGKAVKLKINDRGPFVKGRIIDLSYAAARILSMVDQGVAKVRLEVIKKGTGKSISCPSSLSYSIQVGSFINKNNALDLKEKLKKVFPQVYIAVFDNSPEKYYQVKIGQFRKKGLALNAADKLIKRGFPVLIISE